MNATGKVGIGTGNASESTLTISISGGEITASGGANTGASSYGAAIGLGNNSKSAASISITGGKIDAGGDAYGIGAGSNYQNETQPTISLGYTSATKANTQITSKNYIGAVTLTQAFKDKTDSTVFAAGAVTDNTAIDGKTLVPNDAIQTYAVTVDALILCYYDKTQEDDIIRELEAVNGVYAFTMPDTDGVRIESKLRLTDRDHAINRDGLSDTAQVVVACGKDANNVQELTAASANAGDTVLVYENNVNLQNFAVTGADNTAVEWTYDNKYGGSYTFNMPDQPVTLTGKAVYAIRVPESPRGGTLSVQVNGTAQTPDNNNTVMASPNDNVTITATPNAGYLVKELSYSGGKTSAPIESGTAFLMPAYDISVKVTFATPWGILQGRIDQAQAGETIELTENVTAIADDGPLTIGSGKAVTLDLKGFTLDRHLDAAVENGCVIGVDGTLTLMDSVGGGKITGGYNQYAGGGIVLSGTLYMQGGTITGNTTSDCGGGVYMNSSNSVFNFTGGTITGNTANGDAQTGRSSAGVFYGFGTMNVSGSPVSDDAVWLGWLPDRPIHVTGALTEGASIALATYANAIGAALTDGLSGNGAAANFTSVSDAYVVRLNADGEAKLYVPVDFHITISDTITNGTVTARVNDSAADEAIYGDTVVLIVAPNVGYAFQSLTVTGADGNAVDVDENNIFTMPEQDVTVSATFTPIVYNITYDLAGGGALPDDTSNPATYTVETDDFTFVNPVATDVEHSCFYGWTGTGLDGATDTVEIKKGSTGDRQYTATWGAYSDFTECIVTVLSDSEYHVGWSDYLGYYYEEWSEGYKDIEVKDKDGNLLTYGRNNDYVFGGTTTLDVEKFEENGEWYGEVQCDNLGENCQLTIEGCGRWKGTKTVDVVIQPQSGKGELGNLKWSSKNGTLTIGLKEGVNESVDMDEKDSYSDYPWYEYSRGITAIVFEEKDKEVDGKVTKVGVKSVAAHAFGGDSSNNPYAKVTTVTLPSTLTTIGDYAFEFMTGLESIDLSNVTTIGTWAFNQCRSLDVFVSATVTSIGDHAFAVCKSVSYALTMAESTYGAVSAGENVNYAAVDSTVALTVTPNDGYALDALTYTPLGGEPVAVSAAPDGSGHYVGSFVMPATDVTVTATFKRLYTVTINADAGCVVTVVADYSEENGGTPISSGDVVDAGTVLTVTARAKAGYQLTTTPDATYTVNTDTTITVASEKLTYTLTLNHENGVEPTATANGATLTDLTAIPYGAKVTVTAGAANEGYEFVGWYQTNGERLTSEANYAFYMFGDTEYQARYQLTTGIVTFMDNNIVQKIFTGTSISQSDFPVDPTPMYGFEFDGWDKTVDKINAALTEGNVIVNAKFKAAAVNVTVTLYNGEKAEATVTEYTENKWISLKAEAVEGKSFAYWLLDGEILNYNANTSFRTSVDCTVTAVYSANAVEAVGTATIRTAKYSAASNELVFVAYLTVPDGAKITKAGLVAASPTISNTYTPGTELTWDNADYKKVSSKAVGTGGPVTYTWTKSSVAIGAMWYARPYVMYTYNGEEKTIYGRMVSVTAGCEYDSSEKATAVIRSSSYNGTAKEACFVAYLTIPTGGTIVKAGVVAAPGTTFDASTTILDWDSATYKKVSTKAVGTGGPVTYTWTKSNVSSGDVWYVRPYVIYNDANGTEHTVYGMLVSLTA